MLTADSIQYSKRMPLKDDPSPLTGEELKDFLCKLTWGMCGNFKILGLELDPGINTVRETHLYLGAVDQFTLELIIEPKLLNITHYTLDGHNYTLLLD